MGGAVVVGAAGNGHRQTKGPVVCHDEQVGAGLTGGIGAGGVERSLLGKEEIRTVQRQVSVYLIGGYLVIALDPIFLTCV